MTEGRPSISNASRVFEEPLCTSLLLNVKRVKLIRERGQERSHVGDNSDRLGGAAVHELSDSRRIDVDAHGLDVRWEHVAYRDRVQHGRHHKHDVDAGEQLTHRVLRLAPAVASRLGVGPHDLVELRGRHPAPLRAWVKLDEDEQDSHVPLDSLGRRILGVDAGDMVELRRLAMPSVPGGLAS